MTARICVGWQYAPALADPGPAPARPVVTPPARLDPGWVRAQREIYRVLARPARLGGSACAGAVVLLATMWLTGLASGWLAACATLTAAGGATGCAGSVWRGRRRLAAVIESERRRVAAIGATQARRLTAQQRDHANGYRAWQRRRARFDRQPLWFAVPIPAGAERVDVAGGTLLGWSALVTTVAAPRLAIGGEVTLVDLTEGAVASDLVGLAAGSGLRPLVWVLPGDLPSLDLGSGLGPAALADVLALAASASGQAGGAAGAGGGGWAGDPASAERAMADQSADCALLERVLDVLGPDPPIARLNAALRALANVGDPREDVARGVISAAHVDRVGTLFGRSASERLVLERAWMLEAKLRRLDRLGVAGGPARASRLRVVSLDRRSGVIANRMLGTFVVAALTHMLRQAGSPAQEARWDALAARSRQAGRAEQARAGQAWAGQARAEPWAHTVFLLGADRLAGDVLDRLTDACEAARTGLVLAYRTIPAGVRARLGRGNAALAFMRLGNSDDAKVASELIGTEHRFVIGQLTDTVGASVTGTWGDQYTSTVGTSESVTDTASVSRSRGGSKGQGRSRPGHSGPFGDFGRSTSVDRSYSVAQSGSLSLAEGISSGTSWGLSTSKALGESASLGRTAQRSREFLVEPDELQRLPVTAAIVSYAAPAGRTVVLADTNPAIMTLPREAVRGIGELSGDDDDDAAADEPDEDSDFG